MGRKKEKQNEKKNMKQKRFPGKLRIGYHPRLHRPLIRKQLFKVFAYEHYTYNIIVIFITLVSNQTFGRDFEVIVMKNIVRNSKLSSILASHILTYIYSIFMGPFGLRPCA